MKHAKGKRIRARVGDVFQVPISAAERVYGQVVDQAGPQYLVVLFRSQSGPVAEVMQSGVDLAGIIFDAKLRNGDWTIVANVPPVRIRPPWFVVGHEGLENLRLENFDGSTSRLATPEEAAKHRHRHVAYPMVLQRAAEALHGHRRWSDDLDFTRDLARELADVS